MKGNQGGIVEKEMPINISNVALFNPATQKADRVGFKLLDDGRKVQGIQVERRSCGRVRDSHGAIAGILQTDGSPGTSQEVCLQVDHGSAAHYQDHPEYGCRRGGWRQEGVG
jgi:hypothetical protein